MVGASDIEAIVQEVLRRLQRLTAASAARSALAHTARREPSETSPRGESTTTLRLTERVITLTQLHGRLDGIQNLLVVPRAVVTPAVQDELRQRGIRWSRCSQLAAATGQTPYVVATVAGTLGRELASLGGPALVGQVLEANDEEDAIRKLSDAVKGTTRGVLLAARPFAAVHAAHGRGGLRAAHVRSPEELRAARQQIDANVLVFDAGALKAHAIVNCLRAAAD